MNGLTPSSNRQELSEAKLALEGLAVAHYERVYALCHAFHDDAAVCMGLTNQWFREASTSPSLLTVCRKAVETLRQSTELTLLVPGCGLLAHLTWLLKDLVGLSYADIGAVLDMESDYVKHAIASVREALLAMASEQLPA